MSGDPYDLKGRRIKQLLSSYYTDHRSEDDSQQSGHQPDDGSSVTSASVGTPKFSSIDSPAFNVDAYVHTLIRTARIDTLLKKHGDMVKEIRALDSDMQMLVYENYNKFITATDTIRSMKSNVDGMGEKMEELRTIMRKVAQTSDGVNAKLQTHRDGIEELSRVKTLLQKIQSVIDLPKRMQIAIKEEAFSVAVGNYCEAKGLLQKYGHQGAFRSVAADCAAAVKEIITELESRLQRPNTDAEECVTLLQKLGTEPRKLQELFLYGRKTQIESVIDEASRVSAFMAVHLIDPNAGQSDVTFGVNFYGSGENDWDVQGWEGEDHEVTLASFVRHLDDRVLHLLCESAAVFNSTFTASQQSDLPLDRSYLMTMAKDIMENYRRCISTSVAVAAIQGAIQASGMESKGGHLIGTSEEGEVFSANFIGNFGTAEIINVLTQAAEDTQMVEIRLSEVEPLAAMKRTIEKCIEHHMGICFRSIVHRIVGTLLTVKNGAIQSHRSSGNIMREFGMADLNRIYVHLCEVSVKGLTTVLEDLKQYTASQLLESWEGAFIDMLQAQIQNLFCTLLHCLSLMVKYPSPQIGIFKEISQGVSHMPLPDNLKNKKLADLIVSRDEDTEKLETEGEGEGEIRRRHRGRCPSGVVLLCARLCTFLELSLVPHAVEMLASLFPGAGNTDEPAFNPSDVIRRANTAAAELLRSYIEVHSRGLSLMIRQSIAAANWLHHKEPRGPRPICDLVVTRLESAEKEIVQLIDDGGNRSRKRLTLSADRRDASSPEGETCEGTAVERNVAKLFRERVQLSRKAEFTQSSIQASILGCALQSWIECLRIETLGRPGLQQLQLDVLYLRPRVACFVRGKESEAISSLMEEVIAAAMDRSIDPTLLETAVVDKILSAHPE